ncbi:MAG: alpha/beta hydrolase [Janibacter sp.]|nr:alpha/beta hydrolase [Janibacter sp.]
MPVEPQVSIPQIAAPWGGRSRTVDLGGTVHYVDFDGPDRAPAIVLVHGLGGSHLNWLPLADRLRSRHRVYALDLAGFGFTRGTQLSAAVGDNAELVRRFIAEVVGQPVILVGNSMGGLITTLVAARADTPVRGVVLIDPALPAPRGRPDAQLASLGTLVAASARRSARARRGRSLPVAGEVAAVLRLCIAQWDRLDQDVFEAHVDLAAAQKGFAELNDSFKLAARTMIAGLARRSTVRRRLADITVPVLLIQGDRDRLVHVSSARWAARMNPGWQYVEMPGVGHVPMLEVPQETERAISDWLTSTQIVGG